MTDKIYPDWISDRLPSEKDGDKYGSIFVCYECGVYLTSWQWDALNQEYLDKGCKWAVMAEGNCDLARPYSDHVATPDECLAREQANGEPYTDATSIEKEVTGTLDLGVKFDPYEKITELEQALAESEERVKELNVMLDISKDVIEQNQLIKKVLIKEWGG